MSKFLPATGREKSRENTLETGINNGSYGRLSVAAIWYPHTAPAMQAEVLGEQRTQHCHPIRSLLAAGTEMACRPDRPVRG